MELTSGTRATAAAAAVVMLGGVALTIHGVWRAQAPHSLAGIVLSMIALTVIILTVIHHWVTDTSTERLALGKAQREASAEQARYIALQAALEIDQARLYRDIAADRAADQTRLKNERQAMQQEFEDARTELVNDAMATFATWVVNGKVQPPERQSGNLIRFPHQGHQPGQTPERQREHGGVAP
jgi:hypothetical protein